MPTKVFVEKDKDQILTNKEIVTPELTLESMAYASLPAPTSSGRILRLTDKARGLYLDSNEAWLSLSGNVINALEYMAGDGSDEHEAFQTMLDTGMDIFLPRPPVAYGVGAGLTLSTSYQRIFGIGGASLIKTIGASFNLFTPSVDLVGIEIDHLRCEGAAVSDGTQQYFLYTTTSYQIQQSHFHHLHLTGPDTNTGFNNGLLFDRDSNENTVSMCLIERLVGATSGHGYAVQLGDSHDHVIARNKFLGALTSGRHAVYVGSGASRNQVLHNYIRGYPNIGILLYALSSQDAGEHNNIEGNIIDGGTSPSSENGAIHVDGNVHDNMVQGNIITGFGRNGILVTDGGQGGLCVRNVVQNNIVHEVGQVAISIIGTDRSLVKGNEVYNASQSGAGTYNGIQVSSSGTFGTRQDVGTTVIGNRSHGADQRSALAIDSGGGVSAPTGMVVHGNDLSPGVVTTYSFKGTNCAGDEIVRFTPAVATNVPIQAIGHVKTFVSITGTDGTNMTIDTPTEARENKELTITIRNNSGGSLGTCTFASGYLTTGSWTQPGNAKSRSIIFVYDGAKWVETFRSAADVSI